jgi:hypothetical protein
MIDDVLYWTEEGNIKEVHVVRASLQLMLQRAQDGIMP